MTAAGGARSRDELAPLELAIGMPLGREAVRAPSAEQPGRPAGANGRPETPAEALAAVMLPLLATPPLLLVFSGGRDSSLLLAIATAAAREHGLEPPIPLTYRNAGAADLQESSWQEMVIGHLGLTEWERIDGGSELEFLGPLAEEVLMRHGVRYPPNAHFLTLMARSARGSGLVLGVGGDELFATWRWMRRADVLAGRVAPGAKDLGTLLLGAVPGRLRRSFIRRREHPLDVDWITPDARHRLARVVSDREDQPPRWDDFVRWRMQGRLLAATLRTHARLARDEGARLAMPLLHPRFLEALIRAGGAHGWGSRAATMEAIGSEHLPLEVLRRRGKAWFTQVYWGERARRFAREWDGVVPCPDLVDAQALRSEWLSDRPHPHSAVLLNAIRRSELVKPPHEYAHTAAQRGL